MKDISFLVDGEFPIKIGSLSDLSTHKVAGEVWALDDDSLEIRNFYYDGAAPGGIIIIGLQSAQSQPNIDDAIALPYYGPGAKRVDPSHGCVEHNRVPVVPEFRGETVKLNLPAGVKVADVQWLSVYCRIMKVDFGHVDF